MFKKILSVFIVSILGLGVVVGVVFFELNKLESTTEKTLQTDQGFYQVNNSLSDKVHQLKSILSAAFISEDVTEVDILKVQADDLFLDIENTLSEFGEQKFQILQSGLLSLDQDLSTWIQEKEVEQMEITVSDMLSLLSPKINDLKAQKENLFKIATNSIINYKTHEKESKELSKIFRKTLELSAVNKKAYNNMTRAVMAVMYSKSTSELNSMGRAKFSGAYEDILQEELTKKQKELLEKSKNQFFKTFDHAIANSVSSHAYHYFIKEIDQLTNAFDELSNFALTNLQIGNQELRKTSTLTKQLIGLISGVTVVISLLLGFFTARYFSNKIGEQVSYIQDGSKVLVTSINSMLNASGLMTEAYKKQIDAASKTSSSLNEIREMTSVNASNSKKAKEETDTMKNFQDEATQSAGALISSMEELKGANETVFNIVKTIDEIAFQTNILALNAAVEAARAGSHGAGFAVVADEVRSLASQCAKAADESAQQISSSMKCGEDSLKCAMTVQTRLEEILNKSNILDEIISSVANASSEQAQGIEYISESMVDTDRLIQENKGISDDNENTAQQLSELSEQLNGSIATLSQIVGIK